MEERLGPQPASLDQIIATAEQAHATLQQQIISVEPDIQRLWKEFRSQLHFSPERQVWERSYEGFEEFYNSSIDICHDIHSEKVGYLTDLLDSRKPMKKDWSLLATFLMHDFRHLSPSSAFTFLSQVSPMFEKKGVYILDRHKQFYDDYFADWQERASTFLLPIQFIQGVARREKGESLPHEQINIHTLFRKIGLSIQGRFSPSDYHFVSEPQEIDPSRNQIIIDADPDLCIDVNEAMIFSVVYNLAKNAAKANGQLHYEEKDQSVYWLYKEGRPLRHPRNIVLQARQAEGTTRISVIDGGQGISIDTALRTYQIEMGRRLQRETKDEIRNSEWFSQIERIIGKTESRRLLNWPDDAFGIRKLKIGSAMDLFFVSGFSGDAWDLRSVTSGMGLWGVRYITNVLKGNVQPTNQFDGGAIFSFSFPDTKEQIA